MVGLTGDEVCRALQMSGGNLSMKYLDCFFTCLFLVFSDGACVCVRARLWERGL